MMEDSKVAKKFISAIIGEEVLELDFNATERSLKSAKEGLTFFRMDFSAKIATGDGGHKIVAIELQKAKLPTDIMRFRAYLGGHYQNDNNVYKRDGKTLARQIYCLYFLNHDVGYPDSTVLKVTPGVIDAVTGEDLGYSPEDKDEFVKSLTHHTWIVQIPKLKKHRRNNLEMLLSIFDQDNIEDNKHILNVREEDFPEEYRPIIRRLQLAFAEKEMQRNMQDEDFFIEPFKENVRKVIELEKKSVELEKKSVALEKKTVELEKKSVELEKTVSELKGEVEDKDRELEDKEHELEDKDRLISELMKKLNNKQ
jgi:hypothetical protein